MLKLSMIRRASFFLISLITLVSLISFSPFSSLAQNSDPIVETNIILDVQEAEDIGGNLESWLGARGALGINLVHFITGLIGRIPTDILNGILPSTGYAPGGALGITTGLTASLYAPVMGVSGVQYIAQSFDNFLGKPAYAQATGIGFAGLQPILPIWRGFRNFTYLFASIIFVVIGIMIMLRVKISNQAVISVQSAVPQIITTLVLITFSYAIAGLIIDFMQFIQSFSLALLFSATGTGLSSTLFTNIFGNSFFSNYNFTNLSTADMSQVWGLTQRAVPMAPMVIWTSIVGAIIGSFFQLGTGTLFGGLLGGPVVLLILLICMLVWMFKFYFGCLKCYITAIFKIIIAPLEIAMGAFPNSKLNFNSWVWDVIANLAVFPISILFLTLGNLIIDYAKKGLWTPSIINGNSLVSGLSGTLVWIGTLGDNLGNITSIGIGLAVVALVSKLPEMIPQFIFMIKPSPWEQAIGQSMSGAQKTIGGYGNFAWNTGVQAGSALFETGGGPSWMRKARGKLESVAQANEFQENEGSKRVADAARSLLTRK